MSLKSDIKSKVISVFIVDDHALFREGMSQIVSGDNNLKLLNEASNGQELIDRITESKDKPDVILLDLKMPVMDGFETLIWLKENYPEIKVLILTMHEQDDFVLHLIDLGANGYLLKNASYSEVKKAILAVYDKEFYFSEFVSSILLKGVKKKKFKIGLGSDPKVSNREKEVLELIAGEFTNPEIADKLFLSVRTVESHRKNLLEKLEVKNTAGLILKAIKLDLIHV